MADDIVTQLEWLRDEFYDVDGVTAIVELAADEIERLRAEINSMANAQAGWGRVARLEAEIERLRTLCNDLYHDATCLDPYCLLCGAGIQEWEARRG